jgi:hypothetical protein
LFLWDADVQEKRREQLDAATRRVFEPRAGRPLRHEDLREINENLVGFFKVLQRWAEGETKGQPAVNVPAAGSYPPVQEATPPAG